MKQYKITYQDKKQTKSMLIYTHDLNKEKLPLNIINIECLKQSRKIKRKKRVSKTQLIHLFSELNIMIQANILLNDALEILYENTQHETLKEIVFTIIKSLENGKSLSQELQPFNKILDTTTIAMLKIAQDHGNLKEVMHSLVKLLQNRQQHQQRFKDSLRYPMILLFSLFFLMLFTLYFVVPKFEHLFEQYENNLPLATALLLHLKTFLHQYGIVFSIILAALIFIFFYAYYHQKTFMYKVDKFVIKHLKGVNYLILMMNLQIFFQSIAILLHDKYKFQTAFENSLILIRNSYLKEKLSQINQQIQSGKSISFAFRNSNLFDNLTLRLISVGQKSNALLITVHEIEKIYQKRLDDSLKRFTHYIEPLFFIIISTVVIWIMMAIFIPIWNLSDALTM
jgi:general secretion pathway protein F